MSTDYCSVANPRPGCTPVAGVAIPMTAAALANFKELQRQINRVLAKKGKKLLSVDGRIGSSTMAALNVVRDTGAVAAVLLTLQRTIDDVASNAATVATVAKGVADALGAGAVADPKPTTPPSLPGPNGTVLNPPADAIAASAGELSLSSPLVLAAIGVGVLLLLGNKRRRRRK